MYCESWTKKEAVFIADGKDVRNSIDFLIDIKLLPQNPEPKYVIIKHTRGKKEKIWKMRWQTFLNQSTVGNVAIIPRVEFEFKELRA